MQAKNQCFRNAAYVKDVWLFNRVSADPIADPRCRAWKAVVAETVRVRSICAEPWARIRTQRNWYQKPAPTVNTALASHWLFPPHSRAW